MNTHTLFLVDGSSYLYRAFHALPTLTNTQGWPTGAVYGLTQMLNNLLKDYQPVYAAVVLDTPEKTFREELYPQYKANRPPTPEDLITQIPFAHQVVEALGFPLLRETGVEADDVIGTLARQAQALGMHTVIFTSDKDFAQLVSPDITLIDTLKNTHLDVQGVKDKFGVPPELVIDYLSLIGDDVDNVPGVHQVGPKTAVKWLTTYGSLAQLMEHAQDIRGKVGENLRAALPHLPLARQLVTIHCHVPLACTVQDLRLHPQDKKKLRTVFTQLEFKQALKKLNQEEDRTINYTTILDLESFEPWRIRLSQADIFALTLWGSDANVLDAQIVGVAFALSENEACYVPFIHTEMGHAIHRSHEEVQAFLHPLSEEHPAKIVHDLKYHAHLLVQCGVHLQGTVYDTMLESYVLNSTHRHDLIALAHQHLNIDPLPYEQIAGKGKKQLAFEQIPLSHVTHYAAQRADITLQVHHLLWARLHHTPSLEKVFTQIEMPLVHVLLNMERHGVHVDAQQLHAQSASLATQLRDLEQQIFAHAGETFNLNSPKQLQDILFEKLQLPVLKRTPTKQASTSEEVLEELAVNYPLAQLILDYRSLSKLKSTYTDALPQQIQSRTGRIHTSYHQAITSTGRLSSSHPNLQNIPIRTPEGRRIRQAFVAPKGYRLLAADYSQIELRLMAHLSEDEKLLSAFSVGGDIHRETAAQVFGISLEDVTVEQRRHAKAVNFGLMYGMQAFGLAKQLGIDSYQAQQYMTRYFEQYPGVKQYMESTRELARKQGYVETIFGRRLVIPDIHADHPQQRQYAERTAINAPLQGSAADMIKIAMISIDKWLTQSGLDIWMLMQVHDELVFQVAEHLIPEAEKNIRLAMSEAAQLKVPLVVEIGIGKTWEEAH